MAEKIVYYPLVEIITFVVLNLLGWLVLFSEGITMWVFTGIIPLVYLTTLGRATIVKLHGQNLKIKSLSLFMRSDTIDISNASRLQLHESLDTQDESFSGSIIFAFNRYYELSYRKHPGASKEEKIIFTINNRRKEQLIVVKINSLLKG
jgi:hypothetical protein